MVSMTTDHDNRDVARGFSVEEVCQIAVKENSSSTPGDLDATASY
jgi:hypothetical protein